MPKKRSSIKSAENNLKSGENHERAARNIAFRAKIDFEIEGLDVFITSSADKELLCSAISEDVIWKSAWQALLVRYPHLACYY